MIEQVLRRVYMHLARRSEYRLGGSEPLHEQANLLLVVDTDFVHSVKGIYCTQASPTSWSNKNIHWVSLCFVNPIAKARPRLQPCYHTLMQVPSP